MSLPLFSNLCAAQQQRGATAASSRAHPEHGGVGPQDTMERDSTDFDAGKEVREFFYFHFSGIISFD